MTWLESLEDWLIRKTLPPEQNTEPQIHPPADDTVLAFLLLVVVLFLITVAIGESCAAPPTLG